MLLQYIGAVDPAARRSGLSQRGYGRVLVLQRRKQLNYAVRTVGYSVGGATVTWPVAARTPTPIGRAGKLYRVAVLPPIGSRFTRVMKSRHFTAMSPSRGEAEPATTPFSARGTRRSAPGKKTSTTIPVIGSTGDNITRVGLLAADLETKRQEVLAEFFPAAKKWGRPSVPKSAADATTI